MTEFAFPAIEFENRLKNIQSRLKERKLDALVLTRGENIFYASGFRASHFASWLAELHVMVIPAQGAPSLMTRSLEHETAKRQWIKNLRLYDDHEDPYRHLAELVRESGAQSGKIGIEERFLKVSQFNNFKNVLPEARFENASGLVEDLAASPSAAEQDCMRAAARVTNIGLRAGLSQIRTGVYPYEIIGSIHKAMYDAGQRDFDMSLVAVWSGARGGRMHDTSTTDRIARGDLVTVEIMGVDNHYKAGAQGCVYVSEGEPPPEDVRNALSLIKTMHAEAKAAVKAGVTTGDVYDAANRVYRAARGGDYYRRVGGSMGLTTFTVNLGKGGSHILKPGACFLIQTLVNEPVLLTLATTVMVTETGYQELTKAPTDLEPHI